MNLAQVKPIVDTVLYEGYILYPYRPTAAKNRQRWMFGGVYPQAYFAATGGADPSHMQTQCLLEGGPQTLLEVRVRFLQPMAREVGALPEPLLEWPDHGEPLFEPVPSLTLGGTQFHTWQEAIERDVAIADTSVAQLLAEARHEAFVFDGRRELEPLEHEQRIAGVLLHTRQTIQGRIELRLEAVADAVYRLTVRVENHTDMDPAMVANREQASLYSFASTHVILGIDGGDFVSLMDPPPALHAAAMACDNQGAYPVLVGAPGTRDTLLCSPITLYDHPQVAPESPGDLYDGTEIDEILSLNILAMTDSEKREMAATDPRAAALLARTQALTGDDFLRMHGVVRSSPSEPSEPSDSANPLEPQRDPGVGQPLAYYRNSDTRLKVGDRVRLCPRAGGDIWDLVLDGKTAAIESIERDFEDKVHVAVTIDDDPGRDWGAQRMPGHRFFFSIEEIQALDNTADREARA